MRLKLEGQEAALVSERNGVWMVEPMRFLFPYQAKREARAMFPQLCHHQCRKVA